MNKELFTALELLESEKGIPMDYMLERVEAALISAYKKEHHGESNVRIVLDPVKKDVKVFQQREVVETVENPETQISLEDAQKLSHRNVLGSIVENELKTANFKRLSAVNGKQVLIQGIREAERTKMMKEYENKREEVITATVQRIDPENGDVIVYTGTSNARMLRNDLIPGEVLHEGDMIKVIVTEVTKEMRGPMVTLSRTNAGLVKRLFEMSVPEIADGTVVINGVAREAGSRTKIAVSTRDAAVDPVGACIGPRSTRIAPIMEELRGEKIDIIRYSDDPKEYISAALAPAKVTAVTLDGEKSCKVTVSPDQFSLAIGKEGQNVRLAARLTGFKIDIKAE